MRKAILFLFLIPFFANAQLVKKADLAINNVGGSKLNKAPKKIYIKQFTVMFQHLLEVSATATNKDFSKASIDLGIILNSKLTPESLQAITDKAYNKVKNRLQENGFELVSSDEAKKAPYYANAAALDGGVPYDAAGKINTLPKSFTELREKAYDKNPYYNPSAELSVPVMKFVADFHFVNVVAERGIVASIKNIKGESGLTLYPSGTIIYQGNGRKSVPDVMVTAGTKYKSIEIDGPVVKKKIKESAVAKNHNEFTADGLIQYRQDKSFKQTRVVEADADLYIAKATQAVDEFLDILLSEFLSNYK